MTSQVVPLEVEAPVAPLPFRRALCAVNGSRHTPEVLRQALALVARDGELTCLAVSDARGSGRHEQATLGSRRAREAADAAVAQVASAAIEARGEVLRHPDVRHALVEAASGHDLLVVGAHGRSRAVGILLGSTASYAVHVSPVPVLVVRTPPGLAYPDVVLAASAGPDDARTVAIAAQIAAAHGASLILGHSGRHDDAGVRRALAEQSVAATERMGREPVVVSIPGDPADRLVSMVEPAQVGLVVVGSASRHGLGALTSVSERVAHRAPCSVLVLRHA